MNDIFHEWGKDLGAGSGGDLAISTGTTAINQRVCRRLLTNPGDYLWNLDYGGGLAQFVGTTTNPAKIEAVVMAQLSLEPALPLKPAPQVTTTMVDEANGYLATNIIYGDPTSMQPVVINVPTG